MISEECLVQQSDIEELQKNFDENPIIIEAFMTAGEYSSIDFTEQNDLAIQAYLLDLEMNAGCGDMIVSLDSSSD